ncbi:hypothetical protein MXC99_04840 [Thauera aromatica]|uniref:hypothetical protein n=1 Tax=Thauera aromatica TaxID=59405 RepID=UPI001FFD83B4|nr:hypothetical protein [Thauera aromatica]MCK2087500.1 hypothetical protein [Thauera aromatica]
MNSDLSKSVTCAIGEYLALAELLKRGHEAFIVQGPTQEGWDVAVIRRDGEFERVIRVQVKTIDWPKNNRRTVTLSNALAFDYLVVVLLDLEKAHSRYLILSKSEIDSLASPENPDRNNKSRSWYIAKDFSESDVGVHEDKWEKIKCG